MDWTRPLEIISEYEGIRTLTGEEELMDRWRLTVVERGADYSLGIKAHTLLEPNIATVLQIFHVLDRQKYKISRGNYFLFREKILPLYEAPENQDGGRWRFQFASIPALLDGWALLVMAICGESFFQHDEQRQQVTGLQLVYNQLSVRLWMKKRSAKDTTWDPTLLGNNVVFPPGTKITWEDHRVAVPLKTVPLKALPPQQIHPKALYNDKPGTYSAANMAKCSRVRGRVISGERK